MLVSIVVPVYNTEKYLDRCIASLINQTYQNIEIWLIDDGSTDASPSICDKYAGMDARIHVYHKTNGGEASARNAGLTRANGDFIAFCDSDDEYVLSAIEKLAAAISLDKVNLAVGAYLEKKGDRVRFACTNQERRTAEEAITDISHAVFNYGVGYILSTVNGKLFDMALIRKHKMLFDENWVIGNDTLFIEEYIRYCEDILDIFEPVYIYYKFPLTERSQGMSWTYPDMYKHFLAMKKIQVEAEGGEPTKQMQSEIFDTLIGLLVHAAVYEEYFDGRFISELQDLMTDPLLRTAVLEYRRRRLNDSRLIPFAFKHGLSQLLLYVLRSKAKKYLTNHKKSEHVRLIYQPQENKSGVWGANYV